MKKRLVIITILLIIIFGLLIVLNNKKAEVFKVERLDNTLVSIDSTRVMDKLSNKDSFILYVSTDFCRFSIPCEDIFVETLGTLNISAYKINWLNFKETKLYNKIKYGPTVIIINRGKIVDYLDANSNDDIDLYQDVDTFKNWLLKYVSN